MRGIQAGMMMAGVMGLAVLPTHGATQARAIRAPMISAAPIVAATAPTATPAAAPAAWLQGDPADSLYRAARNALTRSRYREAVNLFREIRAKQPSSGYVADSYYWEAFALYRLGGLDNLRAARRALDTQSTQHPKAATTGDAQSLAVRIEGELARLGDADATAEINEWGDVVAPAAPAAPASPAAPVASAPGVRDVRPARPPRAPRPPRGHRGSDDCADEDDTKIVALNALLQMDAERAMPILRRVLANRTAESACLRRKAVFIVSQQGGEETEEILLDAVRSDPDREVKSQAVFWLSQVGTDQAVGALDSILRTTNDAELQDKAIFALSQHDSPRATAALRTYAERNDAPTEAREKAIFWLGQSGSAENAAFLRTLYGKIQDGELKEKLIFSMSQMGGPESRRWLLDIVKNRNEPVELRKNALFWVGQSDEVAVQDLAGLYSTLDDREMREQLIFVYSQRDEPAAMDRLMEIARRDPDPELRKKALFWIGQSDDPRAAELLQEILEQ